MFSDSIIRSKQYINANIGMNHIKDKQLNNILNSYNDLTVGKCVPFYFCYRSVMLYVISKQNNQDLQYNNGQIPIVHLEFNMYKVIDWAIKNNKRWVITDSNAGSSYFNDSNKINFLNNLDWNAINSADWKMKDCKEKKQAEFLVEDKVDFNLVEKIGVFNNDISYKVRDIIDNNIKIEICKNWYC